MGGALCQCLWIFLCIFAGLCVETCRTGVAPSTKKCPVESAFSFPLCGLERWSPAQIQRAARFLHLHHGSQVPLRVQRQILGSHAYPMTSTNWTCRFLLDPDDAPGGPLQWVQSALEASSARSTAQIAKSQSQKSKGKSTDCRAKFESSQFEGGRRRTRWFRLQTRSSRPGFPGW